MGSGSWSPARYTSHSAVRSATLGVANYADARPEQVFQERTLNAELDPRNIRLRESRDSADNPASTPVILGLDVTGSMRSVLHAMATRDMNALMTQIHERRPITDPHVMVLGIGDIESDSAPLQASQFEADLRIVQQLEKVWLEGGGGGNSYESYALAWLFAAKMTVCDAFSLRAKKGYLFTIGDELPTPSLSRDLCTDLLAHMDTEGLGRSATIPAERLLEMARERWEVFHVVVQEGSYASSHPETVSRWRALLGEDRVLPLRRHAHLAEAVISAMQVAEGADLEGVVGSWTGEARDTVRDALARGIHLR